MPRRGSGTYRIVIRSLDQIPLFRQSLFHEAGRKCDIRPVSILPRVFRVPDHAIALSNTSEGPDQHIVPFILPPAYDKLFGHDPILDLWENLHRTQGFFSSIVMIGYSMPPYDSYAYETLGRLFVGYQQGGDTAGWGHRRVPIQLVTLAESRQQALECVPFLDPAKTRVWSQGFSSESLDWIDWGNGTDSQPENA